MRGLLRWHMDSGTDGIVALGTTGEASVMSVAERQLVLDITVEEVGGKVPVVAGTSSVNPAVVIEQAAQVCSEAEVDSTRLDSAGRVGYCLKEGQRFDSPSLTRYVCSVC